MVIDLRHRTVSAGGVELAVVESGDPARPTVLLVHGWPDTHVMWHGVIEELAGEHHVVAYDTRGMGGSSDPGGDDGFAVEALADDLFAVADAVSPGRPVHVVGHDWGSVQAWEAVCRPEAAARIASFTSISGPSLDHMGHWVRRQVARPTPRSVLRLAGQSASSAYVWFFVSPVAPPLLRRTVTVERWRAFLHRTERVRPPRDEIAATLPEDMARGLGYYRANVVQRLRRPRERHTDVPVLLVVPERDPAIRRFVLDEVPRWVTHLERRDLAVGHWVPLARPELLAAEVAAFVRRLEGAAA